MDAFRDELTAMRTRIERAEEERDVARREAEQLSTRIGALRVERTRRPPLSGYVLACIVCLAIGWAASWAARVLRTEARTSSTALEPSPIVTETVQRANREVTLRVEPPRLSWSRLASRCSDCTGMVTSGGPMMLAKHGRIYWIRTPDPSKPLETSLVRADTPAKADLLAGAWLTRTDAPVVVGRGGYAVSRNEGEGGNVWSLEPLGIDEDLYGAVAHGDRVFAVGEHGLVLRRDPEGTWTREASPTPVTLRAVIVTGPTDRLVAVGDAGTVIVRTNSDPSAPATWTVIPTATKATLRTLTVSSEGETIAAGDHGTMLVETAERSWIETPTPTIEDFVSAMTYSRAGLVLLATRHGKVVTYEPRGGVFSFDAVTSEETLGLAPTPGDVALVTTSGHAWLSSFRR